MTKTEKVVIALSGGVDSSVAAALLTEQGYSVIGVMLRLWSEPGKESNNRCCTPDAIAIARRVAACLKIPFYVIDAREIFYNTVVKSFIDGYAHNTTPNPCLMCNHVVRWDFLLNQALSFNAHYLATGHFARLSHSESGLYELIRATHLIKDQSYVLYHLSQFQLDHALFPIGHLSKLEVRELAHNFNLPTAERPESQDLCFLGGLDYREFLCRHLPTVINPGPIFSSQGDYLGLHDGLAFYTIGQRKGLRISSSKPLYVIAKDLDNNVLIVGFADDLGRIELTATAINWIAGVPPQLPLRTLVKIRYNAIPEWATIYPGDNGDLSFHFDRPLRDITPGQAVVIYHNDICLGGGIISK